MIIRVRGQFAEICLTCPQEISLYYHLSCSSLALGVEEGEEVAEYLGVEELHHGPGLLVLPVRGAGQGHPGLDVPVGPEAHSALPALDTRQSGLVSAARLHVDHCYLSCLNFTEIEH